MQIKLNGQLKHLETALCLDALIGEFCAHKRPVVAELNGEIIKGPDWKTTALKDGDTLELVSFVGGGSINNGCSLFAFKSSQIRATSNE